MRFCDRTRRRGLTVCAVAVAMPAVIVLSVGCGPTTPDYQSIWTTSTTTSASATTTAPPEPISKYLESVGVTGKQVPPDQLTGLMVSIPTPPGWERIHNPNITPDTEVIGKGGGYPTAMLMVFKLTGDFDAAEAIKHGYADAELSENFKRLNASTADFHGFPSAMIEGSYDLQGRRLHSWNRIVIATGSPPEKQRYLVQLTVTTPAEQAFEQAPDVETIIHEFTVSPT